MYLMAAPVVQEARGTYQGLHSAMSSSPACLDQTSEAACIHACFWDKDVVLELKNTRDDVTAGWVSKPPAITPLPVAGAAVSLLTPKGVPPAHCHGAVLHRQHLRRHSR